MPTSPAQFYIFANCNFVPDAYNQWQAHYDDLAAYVYPNEPRTMTYYFGVPLEYASDMSKTTHMLAFEAYGGREDLYETHFHSEAMKTFLEKIPGCMSTGLDLSCYGRVSGWLDRSVGGKKGECAVMRDVRVRCKDQGSREAVLGRLEGLVSAFEEGGDEGDNTLTFMVFRCLDDDVGVRMFGRWPGRAEMERFDRRRDFLEFWLGSKEEVVRMEWKCYVPNGKGWLHR